MIFIKLMQSLSAVISRVNDLLELTLLLWCLCLQVFGHNGVIWARRLKEVPLPHTKAVLCPLCTGKHSCSSRPLQPFGPITAPLHNRQSVPLWHAERGLLQCPYQVCWCVSIYFIYLKCKLLWIAQLVWILIFNLSYWKKWPQSMTRRASKQEESCRVFTHRII